MALPKWTDERTEALTNFVGGESPVSQATVAEAADPSLKPLLVLSLASCERWVLK